MDSSAAHTKSRGGKRSCDSDVEDGLQKHKRQQCFIGLTLPLCRQCQELDIDKKFEESFEIYECMTDGTNPLTEDICEADDGTYFYPDAILVHQFGTRLSRPSDCPLCEFFRSMRVRPELYESHKLLAFRSSESWMFRADRLQDLGIGAIESEVLNKYTDNVFMAVVPDIESIPPCGHEENWLDRDVPSIGAIYRVQPGFDQENLLSARELDTSPDFDRVRLWFDICRREHGNACKQRASHEPILRGFRLIDCSGDAYGSDPPVEEKPWDTEYAALSYVWGSSPDDDIDWPETVLDAIKVTKELGLQYLWVDRCCINQSDLEEKAYLISRMTTVYEAAQFTIVGLGPGASYGLPGVRNTPRIPQPKYHLDSGNMLLSILPDPRQDILESQYWTRGWTYQEGVLSNRRIVFTDTQVYWECRCMAIQESADVTLFHIPQREGSSDSVLADCMLSGIFKGATYSGGSSGHQDDLVIADDEAYRLDHGFPINEEVTVRSQLRGLNEHIREFSKRNLTRDTDTLFAFQGIVGMYEATQAMQLFYGIPVWVGDIPGAVSGVQVTFDLSVSSWYHHAGSDRFMFVSESCQRKPHLPSWTWAGWRGTVTWRAPPNLEHCAYMSDLVNSIKKNLLWSADISLHRADWSRQIRLQEAHSAADLEREEFTLIEIKNPYILNTWERVEDTTREWAWGKRAGRPGRQQRTSRRCDWDTRWYRIGRRLSCIGMSIAITEREWTDKHRSGELISVLIFAGKYLNNDHGSARYLTLRRVSTNPERWERVGTLYLLVPFLLGNLNPQDMFKKIPGRRQYKPVIIQ
ncbi:Nn.00g029230.m01.CDS01 [Neocucurbitaria sp. VM-36]